MGLPGSRGMVAPTHDRLSHRRVQGGVVRLLHPCGGVEVGYGGAGLLDAGNGPAGGGQVPQVEGHGLRGGGQRGVATGFGPCPELAPGGGVGPAGVLGLGVPQHGGDGPGRLAVPVGQVEGVMELRDGGYLGGHVGLGKTREKSSYHGFYSRLVGWFSAGQGAGKVRRQWLGKWGGCLLETFVEGHPSEGVSPYPRSR